MTGKAARVTWKGASTFTRRISSQLRSASSSSSQMFSPAF